MTRLNISLNVVLNLSGSVYNSHETTKLLKNVSFVLKFRKVRFCTLGAFSTASSVLDTYVLSILDNRLPDHIISFVY